MTTKIRCSSVRMQASMQMKNQPRPRSRSSTSREPGARRDTPRPPILFKRKRGSSAQLEPLMFRERRCFYSSRIHTNAAIYRTFIRSPSRSCGRSPLSEHTKLQLPTAPGTRAVSQLLAQSKLAAVRNARRCQEGEGKHGSHATQRENTQRAAIAKAEVRVAICRCWRLSFSTHDQVMKFVESTVADHSRQKLAK